MGLYEDRVKRLHEHVIAHEKKAAEKKVPTLPEIKELLTDKGIEFDEKAKKEDLLKLLEGAE